MTDADNPPTETSPLLKAQSEIAARPVAENGCAASNGSVENGYGSGRSDEENQSPISKDQIQRNPEARKALYFALPALAIGIFLAAADQTLIVSSYGTIGSDLKALEKTSWIATAYFLTLTSFQPLYGKTSDIFGRKGALLFAYIVFSAGCLCCGLARNIDELIVARAVAGMGGGGMTTVVSILLSDIVTLRERGTWQGYLNIIYASGSACGAPLGGFLADSIGWRWFDAFLPVLDLELTISRSFLIQAPMTLVAFISVWWALRMPKKDDSHWKEKLKRVDFLGALILVAAVFGLVLGLDRGSNVSWGIPLAYGSLVASLVLFILFVYVEMKVASEPFAPGHIIFERTMFACYLCNFFSFGGWLAALFYVPLFYQAVEGLNATESGIRLLPAIIAGVSGSLFGGVVMQKTGKYYWLTVIAYTCLVMGQIAVYLFTGAIATSAWGISVGLAICGFSNGIGVTSSLIALISNAAPEDQAVATACSYLFRSMGSVVGVSLSATVVNQVLRSQLRERLKESRNVDEIVRNVRESLDFVKKLPPTVQDIVRNCYSESVKSTFILTTCIVAGAMISSWFIREKKLTR